MTGKMKIRETVFLFASIAMAILPFLPVVRFDGRIDTHVKTNLYSLTDGYFGYFIVFMSALAVFILIYREKARAAGIMQIVNTLIYFVGSFFFVDYYRTMAASDDLMFWFVSWTDSSYSADFALQPALYIGIGAAVILDIASVALIVDKEPN